MSFSGVALSKHSLKKDVMLSTVEAWWAGLCALPFDGAQGDSPAFCDIIDVLCLLMGYYSFRRP
ncbi:hypothetical protein SAMN05428975_4558 [Mucilaginibacter sp. OK268]|nr:hypothetical protein SAMN05428975_4558 [Mucilaginibacter sp. OK268]